MKPFVVTSGTAITKILDQNPQQKTFPVIDPQSQQYLGYIRHDDLEQYKQSTDVSTCGDVLIKVDPKYISKSIRADPHESPGEVLKRSMLHKLDVVAVVDHDGKYTGVLDIKDLAEAVA